MEEVNFVEEDYYNEKKGERRRVDKKAIRVKLQQPCDFG